MQNGFIFFMTFQHQWRISRVYRAWKIKTWISEVFRTKGNPR